MALTIFWFVRNKTIFDNQSQGSMDLFIMIQARVRECKKVFNPDISSDDLSPGVSITHIRWSPPPDWIKLNSDDYVLQELGSAVCGSLLHDASGSYIVGYSCNIGKCTIMHVE